MATRQRRAPRISHIIAPAPCLCIAVLAIGCADVSPLGSGTIDLTWQVSPSGCAESGVDVVEVRATGPHAIIERFGCDNGRATLDDVTPGAYRLELVGFDPNGHATFRSEPASIDVEADVETSVPTLRLLAAPASVDVRWAFSNGRVCGANGVRWISIGAFDEFDYEVASARFACDDGEGRLPPLRAGSYLIEVSALGDDAVMTWRGVSPTKVTRADEVIVDVELDPVE